ncbi:hypothetical protein ACFLVN_04310 [Chloroflexota bacterium]
MTSTSVSQAGARLWIIEYEGYYSRVRLYLVLRIPLQAVLRASPTSGSASELRATEKTLDGVEGKNKAMLTRFDIG